MLRSLTWFETVGILIDIILWFVAIPLEIMNVFK